MGTYNPIIQSPYNLLRGLRGLMRPLAVNPKPETLTAYLEELGCLKRTVFR